MLAHVDHFLSKPLWLCSIPGVLIQLLVLILATRCSTFFVYSKPTLTPTVPHVQTDTPLPFNLTPLSPLGVSPEPFSQTHLHSNPIRQRKVLPLSQSHHLSPPPPIPQCAPSPPTVKASQYDAISAQHHIHIQPGFTAATNVCQTMASGLVLVPLSDTGSLLMSLFCCSHCSSYGWCSNSC